VRCSSLRSPLGTLVISPMSCLAQMQRLCQWIAASKSASQVMKPVSAVLTFISRTAPSPLQLPYNGSACESFTMGRRGGTNLIKISGARLAAASRIPPVPRQPTRQVPLEPEVLPSLLPGGARWCNLLLSRPLCRAGNVRAI
jgi:hypothetical protein